MNTELFKINGGILDVFGNNIAIVIGGLVLIVIGYIIIQGLKKDKDK